MHDVVYDVSTTHAFLVHLLIFFSSFLRNYIPTCFILCFFFPPICDRSTLSSCHLQVAEKEIHYIQNSVLPTSQNSCSIQPKGFGPVKALDLIILVPPHPLQKAWLHPYFSYKKFSVVICLFLFYSFQSS